MLSTVLLDLNIRSRVFNEAPNNETEYLAETTPLEGDSLPAWSTVEPLLAAAVKGIMVEKVIKERLRRFSLGFDYDFGDSRGVHRIGTTEADMKGWDEVTTAANAAINLSSPSATIDIVTDTGQATITALEWQSVLAYSTSVRQTIWTASFTLQAMSPIPDDYENDSYWT